MPQLLPERSTEFPVADATRDEKVLATAKAASTRQLNASKGRKMRYEVVAGWTFRQVVMSENRLTMPVLAFAALRSTACR